MGTLRSVVPSLQLCSCYKHSTTKVWKEHPLYSSFDVHWKWAHWEVLSRRYSFALVTNIAPHKLWKEHPLYSSFDVHWKWARWEVLSRRYSFALVTNIAPQKVWKDHPLYYSSFDVHWKWAHWEVLSRRYSFALVTNIAPQRFGKNIPYIPHKVTLSKPHVHRMLCMERVTNGFPLQEFQTIALVIIERQPFDYHCLSTLNNHSG